MKPTNQDLKELKAIADALPAMVDNTIEKKKYLGADIIKHKLAADIDGKKIDPKKVYELKRNVQTPANHLRRLKKIFQEHGEPGVRVYIDKVKALEAKTDGKKDTYRDYVAEKSGQKQSL